jgi:hypothetical protein
MKKWVAVSAGAASAVVVFVLGSFVEYATGFPFPPASDNAPMALVRPGALPSPAPTPDTSTPSPNPDARARTDVPIVSTAQGAQDAARADVPMGATIDLQRCYATMIARKMSDAESKQVCSKLIGGISH